MNIASVCLALTVSILPSLRQVPMSGYGVDFPGKDLTVNCYGASGTATYSFVGGNSSWDTGPMPIPSAGAPGPYTVRVVITLNVKNGPIGPLRYDTVVVRATPSPIGATRGSRDWVLTWSGDGEFLDFPLESVGANSASFAYPIKGLTISW